MHFSTSFIALFALPLLAAATPWGSPTTTPAATTTVTVTATATETTVSECNTGSVQCCNSVSSSSTPSTSTLLGLLGIVVQGVDVPIGITCTPITAVGVGGGASCSQAPVCCDNDSFSGVVAIGCVPITL